MSEGFSFIFLIKDFMYLFLEKGEGREKERERNISVRQKHGSVAFRTCPVTQARALARNRTRDLFLGRTPPNRLSHTGQGLWVFINV